MCSKHAFVASVLIVVGAHVALVRCSPGPLHQTRRMFLQDQSNHMKHSNSPAAAVQASTDHSLPETSLVSQGRSLQGNSGVAEQVVSWADVNKVAVPAARGSDGRPVLRPMAVPPAGTTAISDVYLLPPANATVVEGRIGEVATWIAHDSTSAHFSLQVLACVHDPTEDQVLDGPTRPIWAGQLLTLDLTGLLHSAGIVQYTQVLSQLHPGAHVRATVGPQPAGSTRRRRAHEDCSASGCEDNDGQDLDPSRPSHHATVYSIQFLSSMDDAGDDSASHASASQTVAAPNATVDGVMFGKISTDNGTGADDGALQPATTQDIFRIGSRPMLVAVTSNCDNRVVAPLEDVARVVLGAGTPTGPTVAGWFYACSLQQASIDVRNSVVQHVPVCFSQCPGGNTPKDNRWLIPLANEVMATLRRQGRTQAQIDAFPHIVIIAPPTSDCFNDGSAGWGRVPGQLTWMPATNWDDVGTICHEMLHNLNLNHATWLDPTTGTVIEYADTTCAMGYGCGGDITCPRCPNAPHMWQLGWGGLVAAGDVQMGCPSAMPSPGDSITLTIRAPLTSTSQFARIEVDSRTVYFLAYKEERAPYEYQDVFTVPNGKKVHVYSYPATRIQSQKTVLLASVQAGGTYRDSTLSVTVTSVQEGSATVRVTRVTRAALPSSPCRPPSSPGNVTIIPEPPAPPLPPAFISDGVPPAPEGIRGSWWQNLKQKVKDAAKQVPKAVIFGAAVGGTVLLVLITVTAGLYCYCRRRHRREADEQMYGAKAATAAAAVGRPVRRQRPAGTNPAAAAAKQPPPQPADGDAAVAVPADTAATGTPVSAVAAAMPPARAWDGSYQGQGHNVPPQQQPPAPHYPPILPTGGRY